MICHGKLIKLGASKLPFDYIIRIKTRPPTKNQRGDGESESENAIDAVFANYLQNGGI